MDENDPFNDAVSIQTYSPIPPAAEDDLYYRGLDGQEDVAFNPDGSSSYGSLGSSPNVENVEDKIDSAEAEQPEKAPKPKRKRENRYKNAPPSVISVRKRTRDQLSSNYKVPDTAN
jgi:hypothetical protein